MKKINRLSIFLLDYIHEGFTGLVLLLMIIPLGACTGIFSTNTSAQPTLLSQSQIANLVASPDRTVEDRKSDIRRKPAELLAFIGIRPAMTVLDLSAGGGYTTELLARAVGPAGHVYGQSAPVDQEAGTSQPLGNETAKPDSSIASKAEKVHLSSPQALTIRADHTGLNNITPLVLPFADPVPSDMAKAHFDLVTFIFNYHDLGHMGVDRTAMNKHIYDALKPGGLYIIADHAGRQGTGISESATLHRVEEKFLIQEVISAGFRFQASADFLRNPLDPRDQNIPESGQLKDGFILKFIKP